MTLAERYNLEAARLLPHMAADLQVDPAILERLRKCRPHRGHSRAAGRIKAMNGGIGIPYGMTGLRKHGRGGRFAHADTAGEAEGETHASTAARNASSTSGR